VSEAKVKSEKAKVKSEKMEQGDVVDTPEKI